MQMVQSWDRGHGCHPGAGGHASLPARPLPSRRASLTLWLLTSSGGVFTFWM